MRTAAWSFPVLALAGSFLVPPSVNAGFPCGGSCYLWELSFSAASYGVHTSPPRPGTVPVYLWFACAAADGMSVAEFAVHTEGALSVLDFTPMNGFLNAGTATELLLSVGGCPHGQILAGVFTMLDPTGAGGSACFAGSAAHDLNVTVECTPIEPMAYENGYTGVSTDGSAPCSVTAGGYGGCGPLSVEVSTWGSVKTSYR
ncbi:MAG: hypothetical protein U0167_03355 [bacterium]